MLALLTASLFACKRERQTTPPADTFPTQLSGAWKGQYGFYRSPSPGDTVFTDPAHTYTMIFEGNGKMTVYDGNEDAALKAEGQYVIQGRELTAQYHYVRGGSGSFSLKATLTTPGRLEGQWLIGRFTQTGGKFYLKKQF
jgi:hypothetical protein